MITRAENKLAMEYHQISAQKTKYTCYQSKTQGLTFDDTVSSQSLREIRKEKAKLIKIDNRCETQEKVMTSAGKHITSGKRRKTCNRCQRRENYSVSSLIARKQNLDYKIFALMS